VDNSITVEVFIALFYPISYPIPLGPNILSCRKKYNIESVANEYEFVLVKKSVFIK
jgi:hypothetical protein